MRVAKFVLIIGGGLAFGGIALVVTVKLRQRAKARSPMGRLRALTDAPAKTHDPAVGQVITFQTPGGLVTHRVRGFARGGFTTQGDANRTPDPWTVRRVHVIGLVSLGIAGGGYVLVFLQQPTAVLSLVLLAISVTFAWSLFFSTPKPGGLDPGARGDGFLAMRAV